MKKVNYNYFLPLVIFLFLSSNIFAENKPLFQKGFSFCCFCSSCCNKDSAYNSLKNLKDTGTERVAITLLWYQKDASFFDIYPNKKPAGEILRKWYLSDER